MSDGTSIEWTDASLNPLRVRHRQTGKIGWHCEHKSEGCRFCYAEPINRRLGTGLDYKPGHLADVEAFLDEKTLLQPFKWKRPRKIFLGSMTDLFGDWVTDEQLDRIFAVMAICGHHTFQVLTKRPERMRAYVSAMNFQRLLDVLPRDGSWPRTFDEMSARLDPATTQEHRAIHRAELPMLPLPNVWLGVSCEDQATADERLAHLRQTPATIRFASFEPLLGPIDGLAEELIVSFSALDWAIVGGESGPHARPTHPDWARSLRDQCEAAGVAYFFKQWGEWAPFTGHPIEQGAAMSRSGFETITFKADSVRVGRVGKKAAGRLLDGVEHSAFPQVRA